MADTDTPIKLIVGLGNPGSQYANTRHNAGFWFIDEIARIYSISLKNEKKFGGHFAKATLDGHQCLLLKPQTYMNLSGQSVQAVAQFYKVPLTSILVAHDELDFTAGVIKLKASGGHGGHNGLRDISKKMGADFWRLRLGIGHPGHSSQVHNYVLNKPSVDDRLSIDAAIQQGIHVLPDLLVAKFQQAMLALHSD